MNRSTDHLLVEVNEGSTRIIVTCKITGKTHHIPVFTIDWYVYINNSQIILKDAFPYLSKKSRELIKTGQYIDPR